MPSPSPIKDQTGKVVGYKTSDNTYLRPTGEVAAYVKNGSTYTKEGQVKGKGDQGLRLF